MHDLNKVRVLAALTASAALSVAALALAFGIAGLAHDTARVAMKAWERQGHVSGAGQWQQANSRLLLARRLNSFNADYHADLGRMMEWRAWGTVRDGREPGRDRAHADRYYREAIDRRPGWGYAWANFAENRFLQGKLDAEFLRALEMAMEQAPWEPRVLEKVAWMGMAAWSRLPDSAREPVAESIRRMVELEESPYDIVRLAAQYGWLDRLRPMLHTERQLKAYRMVLEHLDSRW